MNIIPSIDLQSGQCVRLNKGQFDQVTHYADSPIKVAKQYEKDGASILHIVDLDGAKNQEISQISTILKIREATNVSIQIGGGIRNLSTIERLLSSGIQKIVLGSIGITDVEFTKSVLNEFGSNKFVLAFDVKINQAKNPVVAINGWQVESNKTLWEAIDAYSDTNICDILCTDIDKDGTLTGPNIELYSECISRYPSIAFQASGGIHNLNDVKELTRGGLSSAIIGKALFENKFTLKDALTGASSC